MTKILLNKMIKTNMIQQQDQHSLTMPSVLLFLVPLIPGVVASSEIALLPDVNMMHDFVLILGIPLFTYAFVVLMHRTC
jgi:hypothetical protein